MKAFAITSLVFLTLLASACAGPLGATYLAPGYLPTAPEAVKHVMVVAWAAPSEAPLADMLAVLGADVIKLRRDYLVYGSAPVIQNPLEKCKERLAPENDATMQGVLALRLLENTALQNDVTLALALELYRCADGALLWRGEAKTTTASNDPNLVETVKGYQGRFGTAAEATAAPAFIAIKALVEALPNPVLSDDEVGVKIELESR